MPERRRRRTRLIVYTAIFGGRDRLKDPLVITPGARYICFTDEPLRSNVWEVVRAPVVNDDPRRTSRWYKLLSHRLFDTDYSVWVDGSVEINVDVKMLIRRHMRHSDLATFEDALFECVYELAEDLIRLGLDTPERIRAQISRYRREGFPTHARILQGGVLLRRHTDSIRQLNEMWWQEYESGSVRDMLSLRYCVWRLGIPATFLRGEVHGSKELRFVGHRNRRSRSEFDQGEWSRLTPPASVAAFPSDLACTALEYAGVYEDGWLTDRSSFGLRQPSSASPLVVECLIPMMDDPQFTTELSVSVDGEEVAREQCGPGELELRLQIPSGSDDRRVGLHFSSVQTLPERVPRQIAALVRFIGFPAAD